MTERILTTTFAHRSDADAARAALESSIPGIEVALKPEAVATSQPPSSEDTEAQGPWQLTANVPEGMRDTAMSLLHQTSRGAPG